MTAADVVKDALHPQRVAPHFESLGRLAGAREEPRAVIHRLLDRCLDLVRRIEHAETAVGKARAFRVQVRERCHHGRGSRAAHPALARDGRQDALLLPDPRIGQAFDLGESVEVGGPGNAVPQPDWRVSTRDDPVGPPVDGALRHFADRCPAHPRCASRYWRTTNRSPTLPLNMRCSALWPWKSGALFGRPIHSSARAASGKRICRDL